MTAPSIAPRHGFTIAAMALLGGLVFAVDLLTPTHVADGMLYVAILLLGLWVESPRAQVASAAFAALLTVAGGILHLDEPLPAGTANRVIALVVIASTGALLHQFHLASRQRRAVQDLLAKVQRIAKLGGYELSADGSDWWSDEVYAIAGLDPAVPLTRERYLAEVVHPEDRIRLEEFRDKAFSDGVPYQTEYRIVRPGGEVRYVRSTGAPEQDGPAEFSRLVGTLQDVTAERQAQEAASQSIQQLENHKFALDQAAIVSITDPEGVITYANDQFCRLSGYGREELLGRNHRIVNSGHHPRRFFVDLWTTIRAGKVWRGEIRNRSKDGSTYWVDSTIVPFVDAAGGPTQYLSISSDVTTRKHAEEELSRNAALAHLGQMAAVVAHEVKNPLAGIAGAIDIIGDRLPPESPDRRVVRSILRRIDALNVMVEDLLLFARPRPPQHEIVDLSQILREAAALVRADPQLRDVHVKLGIVPVVVRADVEQVKSAVLNLLLNAAQATGQGTIELDVRADGPEAIVEVRDRAGGIPCDVLPRIFEPFFSTKHRGTGLGLPLARRIAEAHGGKLDVFSVAGQGTTASLRLPRAPLEMATVASFSPSATETSGLGRPV